MKTYFKFNLTGKKLFPIWALFLVFFVVPYVAIVFNMKNTLPSEGPSILFSLLLILLVIIAFAISFFIAKLTIENISLKEKSIEFNGTFGKYIGTVLLGLFLTIITLGIYGPWFIKNITGFYIDNSSYNSHPAKFQGKGGRLFLILLLSLVAPMIILVLIMVKTTSTCPDPNLLVQVIRQVLITLITIPYMYLVYKWIVNVDYKNFNISWKTDFWSSCAKIAFEVILSIITIGIYAPLATLRLYKYFTEKTLAESAEKKFGFAYDIDQLHDFLFIWGQMLLAIITLGIYYPWAYCKITSKVLGKTCMIEK